MIKSLSGKMMKVLKVQRVDSFVLPSSSNSEAIKQHIVTHQKLLKEFTGINCAKEDPIRDTSIVPTTVYHSSTLMAPTPMAANKKVSRVVSFRSPLNQDVTEHIVEKKKTLITHVVEIEMISNESSKLCRAVSI